MKRLFISFIAVLVIALFTFTNPTDAQRARGPKVTSLQATVDKAGAHPMTAQISAPAPITCLSGFSETPNATVSCHIVAPGFTGNLKQGEKANATAAGAVTLTCAGRGFLRCNARIN